MVFKEMDARLNVYALANGMDLTRGDGYRQLEWYLQGRDRGIRLWDDGAGRIVVEARAWNGDPDDADTRILGDAHVAEALSADLSAILEGAIEAANGL